MNWYSICMALHVLAFALWLGHMFFWSLIAGTTLKRIEPPETGSWLRDVSLSMGGLGWPALIVLIVTGTAVLAMRGVTVETVVSGALFSGSYGHALAAKLALVCAMVVYQAVFAHRAAPRAVYLNMAAALTIVGLGLYLVRGW